MNFIADKHLNQDRGMSPPSLHSNFQGKIIDLSIGDIDCSTDISIINAAFEDALNGHTHYTDSMGYLELREEIVKYHKENFDNYNISPSNTFVVSGGCHGMYLILSAILNYEEEVIVFSPYFPVYKDQIELTGGKISIVELSEEEEFQINKERLEEKINSHTKAIIINTPSNPTGICYTTESLNIIKEISEKYNLLVIADDIYDFFSYEKKFTPIFTLPDMEKRVVSICSFSKNFAMTGWRVAYITGQPDIVKTASLINESIVYSTSSISQRAAISALKNHSKIKLKISEIYKERMEYACKRIKNIDFLSLIKPQGGIYLFINIEKTNLSSTDFSNELYKQLGIKVLPGVIFGSDKHVRVSLKEEITVLEDVFNRIEKFIF